MIGGELVREARKRAGMTQARLAELAGTTQSSIARLESGRSSPSFEQVERLMRLCGFQLIVELAPYDNSDIVQAEALLRLNVDDRARSLQSALRSFREIRPDSVPAGADALSILRVLARYRVACIVIGGFAAFIQGSPIPTTDVDIVPEASTENRARLSAALAELDAKSRAEAGSVQKLTTRYGDLDVVVQPTGTRGYEDVRQDAVEIELGGTRLHIASLADIVRSKEAAGRDKDRRALPILRELLARQLRERRDH